MIDIFDTVDIIKNASSKSEICRKLNWSNNGKSFKKIEELIIKHNILTDFKKISRQLKYPIINKNCPVCTKQFKTQKGHKREKTTCSYSCSNTYYRSGENNPNYIDGLAGEALYRKICFAHHEKKCIVCDEKNIVEVHHYDNNHYNNVPENLIPICPTHHKYWHSRHRMLIKDKIDNYIIDFKKKFKYPTIL